MELATAKAGLATRVTQRIDELGTSPEEVADGLDGVSDRTIRRMMSGELSQLSKILLVAGKLERSLSWMVGEELPDYPVAFEPLARLCVGLNTREIGLLVQIAETMLGTEPEVAARPLTRAAEDPASYRTQTDRAASQGTDTGAGA